MPGMAARVELSFDDNEQHLLLSLADMIYGYPVTVVEANKNPLHNRPEDLNEQTLYVLGSDEIRGLDAVPWKLKGEPRHTPFPDLPVVLREITRVFHDGDDRETKWKMLQYEITAANGTFSICRISLDPVNHDPRVCPNLDIIPAPENLPEFNIFSGGNFLELLDLDFPLFPPEN